MRQLRDDTHLILDGEVRVYRRERSKRWQAAFVIDGHTIRISTGKRDLAEAKEYARDTFLEYKFRPCFVARTLPATSNTSPNAVLQYLNNTRIPEIFRYYYNINLNNSLNGGIFKERRSDEPTMEPLFGTVIRFYNCQCFGYNRNSFDQCFLRRHSFCTCDTCWYV